MCIKNYRANKIRKLDKYEIEAVAKKIIDYIEINKFRLLFLTKKQICEELNISHYKLKFYLDIYRNYISINNHS